MTDDEMAEEVQSIFKEMSDMFIDQINSCSEEEKQKFKDQLQCKDQRDELMKQVSKDVGSIGNTTRKQLGDI